jgi:hypothetical protein
MVDNMQNDIHIPCNMSSSEHLVTAQKLYHGSLDFNFSSVQTKAVDSKLTLAIFQASQKNITILLRILVKWSYIFCYI